MRLVVALILACASSIASADSTTLCLKEVELKISSLDPGYMHLTDDSKRKDKIILRMNADCKTGEILVPSTPAEAKDWLELALPYDFKFALTADGDFDPYTYTSYGYSAEYDLYNYFNTQWKLQPESVVCKAFPPKPTDKKGLNWCFYQMLNSIGNDYKNVKRWSPGDSK